MGAEMTRPVTIGNATLYLGDCLEILPTLSKVDAVVTDPPYGLDPAGDGYGRSGRTIQGDKDLSLIAAVAATAARQWQGGWVAAFYSPKMALAFYAALAPLIYQDQIVWDKKAPGMGGAFRYRHENIGLFSVGQPKMPLKVGFSVQVAYRIGEVHPHEKPMGLMREILRIVPGHAILDPFMGSGTTGVACAKLGRKFIGIEIEPNYFDIACGRIEDAYRQGDMFIEPPPKVKQEAML